MMSAYKFCGQRRRSDAVHLTPLAAALKAHGRSLANCPFNLLQAEDEEERVARIKHPLSTQTQNGQTSDIRVPAARFNIPHISFISIK